MRDMQEKICLVVPCYNESKRLDLGKFNSAGKNLYFLFVNDGSTDNTSDILKKGLNNRIFLLDLEKNAGKAEAVRKGFLHLKGLPFFKEIDWVGYWDADLAIPLWEADNFILYAAHFGNAPAAIFGSRVMRLGSRIKRLFIRHIFGRIFATAVSFIFKIRVYDTQCGAKLFKRDIIEEYFNEPFISRWVFDVEIMLRMRKLDILEYPVIEWNDVRGGSLKIIPAGVRALADIIKMKQRYG